MILSTAGGRHSEDLATSPARCGPSLMATATTRRTPVGWSLSRKVSANRLSAARGSDLRWSHNGDCCRSDAVESRGRVHGAVRPVRNAAFAKRQASSADFRASASCSLVSRRSCSARIRFSCKSRICWAVGGVRRSSTNMTRTLRRYRDGYDSALPACMKHASHNCPRSARVSLGVRRVPGDPHAAPQSGRRFEVAVATRAASDA